MKENKPRSKRNHMVINLIQTPSGYSVIQGTQLLNKTAAPVAPIQPTQPQPQPSSSVSAPTQSIPMPTLIKQPSKTTIKQNNLLFLKSPNHNNDNIEGEKVQNLVKSSLNKDMRHFANWFRFQDVADVEREEIQSWMIQWGYATTPAFLENFIKKYHSHRNTIIKLYLQNFHKSNSYLSSSTVRKYIFEDARYLMKIHIFLTSYGLINTNRINLQNQNLLFSYNLHKLQQNKYDVLNLSSSYYTQNNNRWNRKQENQNYLALKKITKNVRPYCDYCGIHCQIVWFQHMRIMDPKEIVNIMKNVNSKNPPLSEKQYQIILCVKCYCNGNFPLLLTQHDFRKITINDHIEGKKKNKRKSKRKEKKLKHKERVIEQEEEYKQEVEEMEEEPKQPPKQEDQPQQQNQQAKPQKIKNHTQPNPQSGPHHHSNGKPANQLAVGQTSQIQKQTMINQAINRIINQAKKQRVWTFQQTLRLLTLVQQHQQDWDKIYVSMRQSGFCQDCSPEDLILYFIRLPQLNVSNLIQQNSDQCFISENKMSFKSDYLIKKVQNNFDNSVKVHRQLQKQGKYTLIKKVTNDKWKQLLNRFVGLHINRLDQRVDCLEGIGKVALVNHKKFDEATKQIIDKMG